MRLYEQAIGVNNREGVNDLDRISEGEWVTACAIEQPLKQHNLIEWQWLDLAARSRTTHPSATNLYP